MSESTLYHLLMLLRNGGRIVSASELTEDELRLARSYHRLFVDKDGFGYVYQPKENKT